MTQQIRALPEKPQECIIILFYFRKFNKITFPFLFLTPNPAICTSQLSFKFMSSSYINCYFLHTCICTVLLVCFKANHLALNTQLRCSSLEMTTSPDPSFPQLSVVLYALLNACGLSICVVLGQLTFGHSCWRHFIVPGFIKRQNLTANSIILWFYSLSASSSIMFPEP